MKKDIVLVVSVSLLQGDQVLLIQENKPLVRDTWNFPSGRIEPGEAIQDAARREVKEETGYEVELTGTTGVYHFLSSLNHHVIMFHFTGQVIGGSLQWATDEIKDARWVPLSEVFEDHRMVFRDPVGIRQILENHRKGVLHPLTFFNPASLFSTSL